VLEGRFQCCVCSWRLLSTLLCPTLLQHPCHRHFGLCRAGLQLAHTSCRFHMQLYCQDGMTVSLKAVERERSCVVNTVGAEQDCLVCTIDPVACILVYPCLCTALKHSSFLLCCWLVAKAHLCSSATVPALLATSMWTLKAWSIWGGGLTDGHHVVAAVDFKLQPAPQLLCCLLDVCLHD